MECFDTQKLNTHFLCDSRPIDKEKSGYTISSLSLKPTSLLRNWAVAYRVKGWNIPKVPPPTSYPVSGACEDM